MDFDFDAEGRTNIAALDNGAANPDVALAGKVDGLQRIVEGAAARVADEGMIGAGVAVLFAELAEVTDIFQLAVAVRGIAGENPVAGRGRRGADGETDDGRGDVFAGNFVANEEIGGGPGLGEVGQIGDDRVVFIGMRK